MLTPTDFDRGFRNSLGDDPRITTVEEYEASSYAFWDRRHDARHPDQAHVGRFDPEGRYRPEIERWINLLAPGAANKNLVLLGPVGVGKTFAAYWTLRRLDVGFGLQGPLRDVPRLLDALRDLENRTLLDQLIEAKILALDDLGAERLTDYASERLSIIISQRRDRGNPTIVTTNLSPASIRQTFGPRLEDRLFGGATVLTLTGGSKR